MIFYKKNNNEKLFKTLENILDLKNNQNYIPIYNAFFDLNYTNYNSINLLTCAMVSFPWMTGRMPFIWIGEGLLKP